MDQATTNRRSLFASKSSFQFLEVESGEESNGEDVPQTSAAQTEKSTTKPTRSALKKAARSARIEKKIEQRLAAKNKNSDAKPSNHQPCADTNLNSITKLSEPAGFGTSSTPSTEELEESDVPGQIPSESSRGHPGPETRSREVENVASLSDPALPSSKVPDNLTMEIKYDTKPSAASTNGAHSPAEKSPDDPLLPATQKANGPHLVVLDATTQEAEKKRRDVLTRTLWTFIMIGGFVALLILGHAYMILLVVLCQTIVYREVTSLFSLKSKDTDDMGTESKRDPWSKTLNWYFFAATNYFLYGESIIYYFKHVVFADAQLLPFATNHRIISFTLYTIGFMGFVMSLKKGYLKQQFGLFCWVHMSLMLIVVSSHFIVNNILEGLIWLWVPASLVICNDVFAYVWGVSVGRTPLIALSPKKTVEGFVGAFWSTIIFGLLWGTYFMQFDYMICPVQDLGVSAWSSVSCVPNPVFVWREWQIWKPVARFLSTVLGRQITALPYATYHLHLLCMSCFASLVAPFGGFFASGFKRAFNIKDFGQSIPGHGGMTDRMDCQFLMGVFTYVYYSSLIRETHVTVGSIMQTVVGGLSVDEQLELLRNLTRYLKGQGVKIQ